MESLLSTTVLHGSLEVFQWHSKTTTTIDDYNLLASASPLLADVCCFPGPHINHLTPSTLDIDAAQHEMKAQGIPAKQLIEGPPRRQIPILLRQTSFQAIQEPIVFVDHDHETFGKHRARFGEIEERGAALTPKGKQLYEELLFKTRQQEQEQQSQSKTQVSNDIYQQHLATVFEAFPDDLQEMVRQDLVYVSYEVVRAPQSEEEKHLPLNALLERQLVRCKPLVYEDFLYETPWFKHMFEHRLLTYIACFFLFYRPASAAGIFTSNLGADKNDLVHGNPDQKAFEEALQAKTLDESLLYAKQQQESLQRVAKVYPAVQQQ